MEISIARKEILRQKKLREFWRLENDSMVGRAIIKLVELSEDQYQLFKDELEGKTSKDDYNQLLEFCKTIATRLLSGSLHFEYLKNTEAVYNSTYLTEQISRINESLQNDPALAIGTAKDLIETCCKTILKDRNKIVAATADINSLTKETLKELKLTPKDIPKRAKGNDIIKQLLSNIATIGKLIAELRNLYGTGHGKESNTKGLSTRHAKLATGSALTLVTFLFETHEEMITNSN